VTATATPREDLRVPPSPDAAPARLRALVGAGQVGYGILKLRRTRTGWYHVLLGARQIVQGRLGEAGAFSPAADAAVDGLHAASMLALATLRSGHRRSALRGAANAAGWAVLDGVLTRPVSSPGTAPGGPAGPLRRTRPLNVRIPTRTPATTSTAAQDSPQPAVDEPRSPRERARTPSTLSPTRRRWRSARTAPPGWLPRARSTRRR
jgi:hypothetical protein